MAVVAERAKEPVGLEEEDDNKEEEAEAGFDSQCLLSKGGRWQHSRSKQGGQLHLSWLNVWLS